MSRRVPFREALAVGRANDCAKMVGRDKPNRLEPLCLPRLRPGFRMGTDGSCFALGSCVAQYVAKRIGTSGFSVLGRDNPEAKATACFSPPTLLQEMAWVAAIRDRDGIVRDEDILPLLYDHEDGSWSDLWASPSASTIGSFDDMLSRRRGYFEHFSLAFEADLVIVLVETAEILWDSVSGSYVQLAPGLLRRSAEGRIWHEMLDVPTCTDYLNRFAELLSGNGRRVLLGVSPTFQQQTLSSSDILVEYGRGKSVLRVAVEEVCRAHAHVDYFPAYEMATLTRSADVWQDDLVHVRRSFIERIVEHVVDAYWPDESDDGAVSLGRLTSLVEAGKFDEAEAAYLLDEEAVRASSDPAVHAASTRLWFERAQLDRAALHALAFLGTDQWLAKGQADWLLAAYRALLAHGGHGAEVKQCAARLVQLHARSPKQIARLLRRLKQSGDTAALRDAVDLLIASDLDDADLNCRIATELEATGDHERALKLIERQLARTPDSALALELHARMLMRGQRYRESAQSLRRLTQSAPDSQWAHSQLLRVLLKTRDWLAAANASRAMLGRFPDDSLALAYSARSIWELGDRAAAKEAAERALATGRDDKRVLGLVGSMVKA